MDLITYPWCLFSYRQITLRRQAISSHDINCTGLVSLLPGTCISVAHKPISQIPQWTSPISYNALFRNRNLHIYVHISVTEWWIVGYLSNALWDLWDGFIVHIEARTKWLPFCRKRFICIFVTGQLSILILISLKLVPKGAIANISGLVEVMTKICNAFTRPQQVHTHGLILLFFWQGRVVFGVKLLYSFTNMSQGSFPHMGESCNCPDGTEVTMEDMGKINYL